MLPAKAAESEARGEGAAGGRGRREAQLLGTTFQRTVDGIVGPGKGESWREADAAASAEAEEPSPQKPSPVQSPAGWTMLQPAARTALHLGLAATLWELRTRASPSIASIPAPTLPATLCKRPVCVLHPQIHPLPAPGWERRGEVGAEGNRVQTTVQLQAGRSGFDPLGLSFPICDGVHNNLNPQPGAELSVPRARGLDGLTRPAFLCS